MPAYERIPILLVEDDENDVLLLRRALRICNFPQPVRVARDGDAAISYLRGDGAFKDRTEHPLPALILTDLKMPKCSGFELLAWIRERPEFAHLPVIVLSSSGEASDIDQSYQLGASFYFVKPSKFDECISLVKALGHWLRLEQPLFTPERRFSRTTGARA
jgi:CheY-like chemotaxis protein